MESKSTRPEFRQLYLKYEVGNDTSSEGLLVSLYVNDEVVGKFRMDWSHWPFSSRLIFYKGSELSSVLQEIAERGRKLRLQDAVRLAQATGNETNTE